MTSNYFQQYIQDILSLIIFDIIQSYVVLQNQVY